MNINLTKLLALKIPAAGASKVGEGAPNAPKK